MVFIEGATLAHYAGDREAKRAEVAAALEAFDAEFLAPSIARRRVLLAGVAAGDRSEDDLPRDVLTTLLAHDDDLHLPPEVLRREIAFFLLAGAHTSATAFVRTLHHVLTMADDPARRPRAGPHRPGASCSAACTRPSGCSPRVPSPCAGPCPTSSCRVGSRCLRGPDWSSTSWR